MTFVPGDKTQTVSVTINGDVYFESKEAFSVNLSNSSSPAIILDNEGVGTITNDDGPPGISVSDVKVFENAGGGQFAVTLAPAVNGTVTVDYVISDDTAVNGVQYNVTPTNGTLTFTANTTSLTIPFTVVDNTLVDGKHTFNIQLSNSSGPSIARSNAIATILDNEIKIVEMQGPPPATQCTDTNFENPGIIRSHFTSDVDRPGLDAA